MNEEKEQFKIQMTSVILKYLSHFGYAESLARMKQSLNLPIDAKELEQIKIRRNIMDFIKEGKIEEALNSIISAFPHVQNNSDWKEVLFKLHCQQFIELIRRKQDAECLTFASEQLGSYGTEDSKYRETLEDVVALLAYEHPETSPVGFLMSQQHRDGVAQLVNSAILISLGQQPTCELERLLKQLTLVQSLLDKEKRWTVSRFIQDPNSLRGSSNQGEPTEKMDEITIPDWMQE